MGDDDKDLGECLDKLASELDDSIFAYHPSGNHGTIGTITSHDGSIDDYHVGTDYTPSYSWAFPQNEVAVPESGDIKIGERSLKQFMDKVESRLAILTPDSKKLEKFAALRKAYEHYKTLEQLCELEEEDDNEDLPF